MRAAEANMAGDTDDDLGSSATMAAASEQPAAPAVPARPSAPAHTLVGHGDVPRGSEPPPRAEPPAGSQPPLGSQPAVVRGGGPRDYPALQPVDPKHFVPGEEIARGGMGRIIKARDRRLGRDIAIKELLYASADARVRFEREARITAQLQHPAIVNILEAGTWPSGEPFYVMKLVDGQSLDRAIAAARTRTDRLALLPSVITVVEALAFAHSRRVIHRDLKPANVLVGRFGEIVVIDWGLAKDLAQSGQADSHTDFGARYRQGGHGDTVVGAVMGTPTYMPAEQARGEEVDERADVYALGAMLYHLLAGAPPVTGKTVDDILAKVIAGPVPSLARVAADLPADLVAIVDKAMAFDARDRYPTAQQLADDLLRFRTGQLVGAHRYTTRDRLARFVRRYRVQLTAAAIALVVLAGFGAFSVDRIVDERDAALAARAEADAQRKVADEAKTRADTARAAAEDMVGFILTDLKPGLERVGQLPLMKGIAKQVGDYYQRVTTVDALDAAAVKRRAEALSTLGDVFAATDEDADSKRAFDGAIAMLTGQPDAVVPLARARFGAVIALTDLGDAAAARALVDAGLAGLGSATGPDVELARARFERYRGIALASAGKLDDAIAAYTAAIDRLGRTLADPKLGDARADRAELAKLYDRRGDARHGHQDRAGALDDARAGLAVRQQLDRDDPGDLTMQYGLEVSYGKLYDLAMSDAHYDDARQAAQQQQAIAERLAGIDPSNLEWMKLLLAAAEHASDVEYQGDHFDAAYARLEHPLELARQLADRTDSLPFRDVYADLLCHAADDENQAGRPDTLARAADLARRCLAIAETLHARSPDNLDYARGVASAHDRLGDNHAQRNDWPAAVAEYKQRLAIDEELLRRDPDNPRRKLDVASTRFNTGMAATHVPGHQDEAAALEQTAVGMLVAMKQAGQLPGEYESTLSQYEATLAQHDEQRRRESVPVNSKPFALPR
jgi:tetratricopeptide (TPR) repeat protein/tRNA A-37 threonylcarbamoyl transferase component Bud32